MCKKLIVLVFCASVLFSGVAMAEVDDSGRLIVPETSVAPIIDGELDDVWQNVGEEGVLITEIINTDSAVPEDLNDLSGTFKVMHDADNFYIYVVIQDSVIDYEFSNYNGDGVEIFFDGDNSKGSSYDGVNDNQIRITVDDVELTNIDSSLPVDGSAFKVILTDLGYNIEASFPLETLQIVPENTFGFEVQINDNDGGGGRETMIRWFSNDNNSWSDASLFGEAILVPELEPVNPGAEGLVAHWPLDEGAGNTAADIVGGHDGTLKGGVAWAGEGSPVNGDALSFDGYSDGVSHATDPGTINWVSVDPFDVVGPGITLAAWIRPEGFDIGDARIITKQKTWSSSDIWWMLSTYTDGTALRMRLKTDDGGADNGTTTMFSDTGYLEAGVWSHVAATYDGSKMRLYHNAVEIMSTDKTGAIQTDPTVAVAIGNGPLGDPGGLRAPFHGLIDDVRAYSRVLSEPEVRYLAGKRATPVDPGTDGLVAFYPLENDVLDGSGNGNDGTIVGNPTFVEGPVGYGMAMEFDGESYVDCGNDPSLDITGPISMGIWIRPGTDGNVETAPLCKADASAGWSWQLRYGWGSGGKPTIMGFQFNATGGSVWIFVNQDLAIGEWYHIAASHDGATVKCYLDGVETDSAPMTDFAGGPSTLLIGSDGWRSDWIGAIDEVAIYNRDLSGGEARYLAGYRAPVDPGNEGLVAHYTMENDATDSSGNNLNGTLVGDPGFVDGVAGMALELDGVDDRAAIADDPAFDAMSETFTITAWIKLSAEGMTGRRPILSKELQPDPDGRGWEFKVDNGQLAMQLYSPVEGEGKLTVTGTTALEADQWVHVAGIYQADGPERFYINGVLDHEQELVTALQANASPANIGAYIWSPTGYQAYFAGLIDEVRAYSRVLSEPEIRYLAGDE